MFAPTAVGSGEGFFWDDFVSASQAILDDFMLAKGASPFLNHVRFQGAFGAGINEVSLRGPCKTGRCSNRETRKEPLVQKTLSLLEIHTNDTQLHFSRVTEIRYRAHEL